MIFWMLLIIFPKTCNLMDEVKFGVKIFIMNVLFFFLEAFSFNKKKLGNINNIAILFLPPLGIGDLVMLSPAIRLIKNIFPQAKISLLTWIPGIINFEGIEFVNYKNIDNKSFDLVISPTLNLRHLKYILKSKYWIGYFTKSVSQSNFCLEKCRYDLRSEHYLFRTLRLTSMLGDYVGSKLNQADFKESGVIYPSIIQEKPKLFDDQLNGCEYFVLGALSKWPDRQWPMQKFVEVVTWVFENKLADKLVIIGDSSKENKDLAGKYLELLKKFGDRVVNLAGVTTLTQTAYVLAKSKFYLGLDSGPSHLAYLLSPKSISIFITVDPKLRLPFLSNLDKKVSAVYLNPPPAISLYNGLGPVNMKKIKIYISHISVDQTIGAIRNLLLK